MLKLYVVIWERKLSSEVLCYLLYVAVVLLYGIQIRTHVLITVYFTEIQKVGLCYIKQCPENIFSSKYSRISRNILRYICLVHYAKWFFVSGTNIWPLSNCQIVLQVVKRISYLLLSHYNFVNSQNLITVSIIPNYHNTHVLNFWKILKKCFFNTACLAMLVKAFDVLFIMKR